MNCQIPFLTRLPLQSTLFVIVTLLMGSCRPDLHVRESQTVELGMQPEMLRIKDFDVLAFGSCNRSDLPQRLWEHILRQKPDVWVWLGDNIYGDTRDQTVLARKYEQQRRNVNYQKLRARIPIVGTWDDHDYGENDSGRYYPLREISKKLLLTFLDEPPTSPRWTRSGVYTSYLLGYGDQTIKLILLDGRSFREDPGEDADLLGSEQWQWLEQELQARPLARSYIIASSSQVIPTEHRFEKWHDFPRARSRLLNLLERANLPSVLLMSGDRHHAEISRLVLSSKTPPLYEITSSGLTHSRDWEQEPNVYRVGEPYYGLNFGIIRFLWHDQPASVILEARDERGRVRLATTIPLF
jgi:alkaline phosphatase D